MSEDLTQEKTTNSNSSMSDCDFYWDWLKHGDHLFVQRSILFVIAETALFAALSSLPESVDRLLKFTIYLLGITVTLNWYYIGHFYSFKTQKYIREKFKASEPRWVEYATVINNGKFPSNINKYLGVILPLTMLIAWIILIIIGI